MWEFVKSNSNWWLKIETVDELLNYHELTSDKLVRIAIKDDEHDDKYRQLAKIMACNENISMIESIIKLNNRIIDTQIKYLMEGKVIFINDAGGYNFFLEFEKSLYKEKLIFPHYTEKDIRVFQWGKGEGFHWYAKIGEVEVRTGDVLKWNTYDEAYKEALKYTNE